DKRYPGLAGWDGGIAVPDCPGTTARLPDCPVDKRFDTVQTALQGEKTCPGLHRFARRFLRFEKRSSTSASPILWKLSPKPGPRIPWIITCTATNWRGRRCVWTPRASPPPGIGKPERGIGRPMSPGMD